MKQYLRKVIDVTLLIIVVLVVVWTVHGYMVRHEIVDSPRSGTYFEIEISVDGGKGAPVSGKLVASGTVLDATRTFALEKALAFDIKEYPGMGTLVTRIGESKNGDGGAYWQYWMNGVYATSSADAVAIRSGDYIEWRLETFE